MSETKGYNPKDPLERRVMKAWYFFRSMVKKGQAEDKAFQIAHRYYHVPEKSLREYDTQRTDAWDDDVYFTNGAIFISASEMLNEGDFC